MEGEGPLQTLAEVSVALAGFASLLVVLRRGPVDTRSPGRGLDLFVVVGGNLLVLMACLLPMALHHLGASDALVWRGASGVLAASLLGGYVAVLRRRARLLRAGLDSLFPRTSRVAGQAPLLLVALLVADAAGAIPGAAGAYILALVLLLALSALPLLLVVVELSTAGES